MRGDVAWHDRPARPLTVLVPLALCLGVLVLDNVATNLVVPQAWYVPVRLCSSAVLVLVAVRLAGCRLDDLGLARDQLGEGFRWGGAAMAVVAGTYVVGALLPPTRPLYLDARARDLTGGGLAYMAFVAVPVGTVLLEELAFRSVLPALLVRRTSIWRAVLVSSVLFGFWHVLPSIGLNTVNPWVSGFASGSAGQVVASTFAVVGTFVAGVCFSWLRFRSGSVVASMLLHVSTNTFGYVVAFTVARLTT